tara:strand:+ start:375 stop:1913 length:1539 start_codon:yes stop_codon:yes gene_type:complete
MQRKISPNGFTLIELIIASAISATVIASGIAIVQVSISGNKLEEKALGLGGSVNDTLDFIMDEVNRGRRIIDKKSNIQKDCRESKGIFLFGISLPSQALTKEDYESKDNYLELTKVDCPIVYTLQKDDLNDKDIYNLIRFGPSINEKGYYDVKRSKSQLLLEGITSSYKKESRLICPKEWEGPISEKGIQLCIDNYRKAIEISISAVDVKSSNKSTNKSVLVSTYGGFNRIQDENLINQNTISNGGGIASPACDGSDCCWLGVCLKSNKITFMIDISRSMKNTFSHAYCESYIKNKRYENYTEKEKDDNNCEFKPPRIQGMGLLEAAKADLRRQVEKLPTSDRTNKENAVWLQIIAFNDKNYYLFDRAEELTPKKKQKALDFIDDLGIEKKQNRNNKNRDLSARGKTYPWDGLCKSVKDENIGHLILLTDGVPTSNSTNRKGSCGGIKMKGDYAKIINTYNNNTRSKSEEGSLIIDTISFFHNYCDINKNQDNSNWLSQLSSSEESECHHID